MSCRRSTPAEAGVLISISIALVGLCIILAFVMLSAQNRKDQGGSDHGYSRHKQENTSSGPIIKQSTTKTYEPPCDTPPDRDEYNACQARRSADAAYEQAKWAFLQFLTAAIAAIALVPTLWFAFGAYSQAKIQACAARKQARIAELSYSAIDRPYVFAKVEGWFDGAMRTVIHPSDPRKTATYRVAPMKPRVQVSFVNHGKSPAVPISMSHEFVMLNSAPGISHVPIPENPNDLILPTKSRKADDSLGYEITDTMLDQIRDGKTFLWFYGIFRYRSPTGLVCETEFCWRYNGLTKAFMPWSETHNRMT